LPVNDEHASKKYYQRQGKGNHSQPGAMVRLTVSGKARVFSG